LRREEERERKRGKGARGRTCNRGWRGDKKKKVAEGKRRKGAGW